MTSPKTVSFNPAVIIPHILPLSSFDCQLFYKRKKIVPATDRRRFMFSDVSF